MLINKLLKFKFKAIFTKTLIWLLREKLKKNIIINIFELYNWKMLKWVYQHIANFLRLHKFIKAVITLISII